MSLVMKLVKLIVEIRYDKIPKSLDFRRRLFKLITNQEFPKERGVPSESFGVISKNKKVHVLIGPLKSGVDINQPDTLTRAVQECTGFFRTVGKEVSWEELKRIGVRSMWVHPVSITLDELKERFRQSFYKDIPLVTEAEDVAVCLTLKDSNKRINFNAGPMEKAQLISQFLPPAPIDETKIPATFAFIDYDYYKVGNISYSVNYIQNFIDSAVKKGKIKAEETIKILGV